MSAIPPRLPGSANFANQYVSRSTIEDTITDTLIGNTLIGETITDGTFSTTAGVVTGATITDTSDIVAAKFLFNSANNLVAVNTSTPSTGQVLTATSATGATWQTPSSGSGPSGLNTEVQYNNAGAFAGNANLTFNQGTGTLAAATFTDGTMSTTGGVVTGATITAASNTIASNSVKTTGAAVNVAAASPPSTGQVLTATSATTATWQTPTAATIPGGPNNSLQYNNAGTFGGTPGLVVNGTNSITATGIIHAFQLTDGTFSAIGGSVTHATIIDSTDNVATNSLKTTGAVVNVAAAAPPSTGQALVATSATTATWQTPVSTPGGANTQVQYNNSGAFAGNSGLTTNGTNLTATGIVSGGTLTDGTMSTTGGVVTGATIISATNNVATNSLKTTGAVVNVESAAPPTNGQILTATSATTAVWQTPAITPGGSDTQVQFNSAGNLAGSSDFTWNQGSTTLTLNGTITNNTGNINAILGSVVAGSDVTATGNITSFTGTIQGVTITDGTMSTTGGAVTNSIITAASNNVAANSLKTTGATVDVASAAAPTTGQILTATSATSATWQTSAASKIYADFWDTGLGFTPVAANAPMLLANTGPSSGASSPNITRGGTAGTFVINQTGVYWFSFTGAFTAHGQLVLVVNGVEDITTTNGNSVASDPTFALTCIRSLTSGDVFSLNNPAGNSTTITVSPSNEVETLEYTAHLTILQLA